jgi:hypothetical protein
MTTRTEFADRRSARTTCETKKIHNEDKHTWTSDPLSPIPRGSRTIVAGVPNSGKTTRILNMIASCEFEKIILINDPRSKEYDILDCDRYNEMIDPDDIDLDIPTLIILEDLDKLSKQSALYLDRVLRIFCSHFGLSVIVVCQNYFVIPVGIRRKVDNTIIMTNSIGIPLILTHLGMTKRERDQVLAIINKDKKMYDYMTSSSRGLFLNDKQMHIN